MKESNSHYLRIGGHTLIIKNNYTSVDSLKVPAFVTQDDKYYFDCLKRFLKMPYIIDSFNDHTERRSWRQCLSKKDRKIYDNNKLRLNHVGGVVSTVEVLLLKYPNKFQVQVESVDKITQYIKENWDTMSAEDKIKYIENTIIPLIKSMFQNRN